MIDRVSVIVGILALVMGSAAVYGILNVNNTILAKPEQVNIPDYTNTLDSMKTQVGSINSQVNSLGSQVSSIDSQIGSLDSQLGSIKNNMSDIRTLKTDIADIHEKLADLEGMKTSIDTIQQKLNDLSSNGLIQQVDSTSGTITVSLDRTTYLPGNTVHITAIGADPLKVVQIQLLDSNGVMVTSQNTWADSTGSVHNDLVLSSTLYPGTYQVKLVSDNASGYNQLTVSTTNTTPSGSYLFTAQTDKGFYQQGDMIQISGMTQPSSLVSATMSSPSGKSFTSSATANSDGTYTISFSVLSYYESGPWNIIVNSLGQTRTISVYLESGGTNSFAFTANTDKTSYNVGDIIQVTGTSQPASTVSATMTSPSGSTYSSSATSGSDGSYTLSFVTSSSYQQGSWSATVTSLGQTKTLYFTLGGSSSSTFTAQTDKSVYSGGDIVQVAGSATPGSAVSEVLVSPSGSTYDSSATTNSYGSYVIFFSTTGSYPKGSWYVDVSNLGQSKVLSFTLQ
ncbi:MAG TPA: hypothetical protein VJ771_03630 [Candidatus Nitrosotalea sp.]|nr:hypothetical protein [Candidatus Nitrosotalea sp.]